MKGMLIEKIQDCLNAFACSTPINTSKAPFTDLIIIMKVAGCNKKLLKSVCLPWIISILIVYPEINISINVKILYETGIVKKKIKKMKSFKEQTFHQTLRFRNHKRSRNILRAS